MIVKREGGEGGEGGERGERGERERAREKRKEWEALGQWYPATLQL